MLVALVVWSLVSRAWACTTILVGREASGEGKPITSQTVDCNACDFRLSKVPRRASGAERRPVFRYRGEYPRFLGVGKGRTYETAVSYYPWKAGEGFFQPIGWVDEPEGTETFAFVDGTYGIMNERGLAIGESTCAGVLTARPASEGGQALVDVRELTLLAMEQCATARCAVETMGRYAETYGYYGAVDSHVEAGEALTIVDTIEAWVFHVIADDTGSSAVWAARRVDPDSVAIVANQFIIGDLPPVSSFEDGIVYSTNLQAVATRAGLWKQTGGTSLNFAAVFGYPRGPRLAPYATRRMWRVMSLAAPSLDLSPDDDCEFECFPFSVKAEAPFSASRVVSAFRDHYEGTDFDATKGLAAGPYGDPSRFDPADTHGIFGDDGVDGHAANYLGNYERVISLFRCVYSFVTQPSDLAVFWVAQYAPHASTHVPVYVDAPQIPDALATGSLHEVDLGSLYWPHALVGNWAARFYAAARPILQDRQALLDAAIRAARIDFETQALPSLSGGGGDDNEMAAAAAAAAMAEFSNETANYARDEWIDLFFVLAATLKDGQLLTQLDAETLAPRKLFYPVSWLESTGFFFPRRAAFYWTIDDAKTYWLSLQDSARLATAFVAGAILALVLVCVTSRCFCRD
ncbi:hypothetical protein CTAYLR_001067 [Chrysophaeum taylorii]|uniref:Dipeptidase n=1 Tax=Chrysophaeum taylorii TaxID=2483200 RepID=A0AAD7XQ74_9STRA|nr:hypothetical protein CTAYLR_001067 [Chrysophaeum taylorii]